MIRNNRPGTHEFPRTLYRVLIVNCLLKKVINKLCSHSGCITHPYPLYMMNTFIEMKT
jgi:hypothetical protein